MPELVSTPKFERAYARHTKRNAVRRQRVDQALARLAVNPLDPRLRTHPLSGDLEGYQACSCGYDSRIVFLWHREGARDAILLINIGTHDEVY